MSGYIENEIIEANRLRSQEALSGNNENPAQWTNTLSNIYELNAGDKVSMYSGFISEKGAGSSKTIELKGKTLGKKKKFTYITENRTIEPVSRVPVWSVVTQVKDEEIELRDNEANLILNYYKNTNGTGYIGLPRLGALYTPAGNGSGASSVPYKIKESTATGYISPIPSFDFMIKDDYQVCVYNDKTDLCVKVKNDNTKFTLFISRYSNLGSTDNDGWKINAGFDDANEPVDNWTIAPEYREYYVYRQKLPINVDKGFNSAQFIADDLTQKLQGIISETTQIYRAEMNQKETENHSIDMPVNKIIESETYKTFNCATQQFWNPDDVADLGDGSTKTNWYNNYQVVGWKRPELYETGQFINMNASDDGSKLTTSQDRLLGSSLRQELSKAINEPLRTNIPYTKDNLLKLKAFIDAQSLYPEIWESWNDDPDSPYDTQAQITYGTPLSATENFNYNHTHTINNTRFFHMNVVPNDNLIEIEPDYLSIDSAIQIVNTTVSTAYTSGSLDIDIPWNGGTNTLYDPSTTSVGSFFYLCSATVTIGGTKITRNIELSNGNTHDGIQTLSLLSSGFTGNLSVGTAIEIKAITISSQLKVDSEFTSLGSSLYRRTIADPANTVPDIRYSKLFLVYYNPDDKDTYYDEPDIRKNKLTYGCFTKEEFTYTNPHDATTITTDFINIHPSVRISNGQSVDLDLAHWVDPNGNPTTTSIEVHRKFGYDLHFTACCNPAITLFNGKETAINYYGEGLVEGLTAPNYGADANTPDKRSGTDNKLSNFLIRRYVGADNPSITWDGEHFGISNLHTGENLSGRSADGGRYIANPVKSGGKPNDHHYITSGIPDDQGDPVYIINPFQNLDEFCPAIVPYIEQTDLYARDGSKYILNEFNLNYTAFNVYDSKSGIFLEDMGYDEDTWDDGLWGIMGFSYEQFNGANNTRILRVDNNNIKTLKYPTTNADIKVTNTKNWDTNENGKPHFSDNVPTPFSMYNYSSDGGLFDTFRTIYPNINVKTSSIQLRAENFPTSMIKGYYTIRSDIVPQSIFVGGRSNITNMPIVGTITKENPQADYFFAGESNIEFTIGKPVKLTSITVSIHDPDGSYANVNTSSSVLFKIQRQMNVSFNVIGDILQQKNSKKSKL